MHPGVLPRVGQPGCLRGGLREEPRPALADRPVLDRTSCAVAVCGSLRSGIPPRSAGRPGRRGALAGSPVARQPPDRSGRGHGLPRHDGRMDAERDQARAEGKINSTIYAEPGNGGRGGTPQPSSPPKPPGTPSPFAPGAGTSSSPPSGASGPGSGVAPAPVPARSLPPGSLAGRSGRRRADRQDVAAESRHEFRDRSQRFVANTLSERAPGKRRPPSRLRGRPRVSSPGKPAVPRESRMGRPAGLPAGGSLPRIQRRQPRQARPGNGRRFDQAAMGCRRVRSFPWTRRRMKTRCRKRRGARSTGSSRRPGAASLHPGAGRRALERPHSQDSQVQRRGRRRVAAERQPLRGDLAAGLHPGPDQRPRLPVPTGEPLQRRAQRDPPAVRVRAAVLRGHVAAHRSRWGSASPGSTRPTSSSTRRGRPPAARSPP